MGKSSDLRMTYVPDRCEGGPIVFSPDPINKFTDYGIIIIVFVCMVIS